MKSLKNSEPDEASPQEDFSLALAVLLVTQLAGCNAAKGIQPSQTTSTQFLQKMKTHQYAAAYGLLSSKCNGVATQQQVQNYWALVEKNRGKVQGWSQQGTKVYAGTGGSSVTLTYGLQCAKGTSGVQFVCVDENGKWLIQRFDFRL